MVGNIFKNYQQGAMIENLFSLACGECGLFLQAMSDDKHNKERGVDSIGIRLPAGGREISKLNSIVAWSGIEPPYRSKGAG